MIKEIINQIQDLQRIEIEDYKFTEDEILNKKCKDMLRHFQDCIFKINMKHCEKSWFDNTLLFDNNIQYVEGNENA